ncbi:YcnI family protein [Streptomyces samsunensis]|uniref:YcnI family protein n=2 Tax=Streptomyces malaysiensis TaxID=92644 RepID=A0A9X2RWB9_STRMQ|nr:YcnI family protein [Streptomyces samsunensis]MCQ8830669.1 YcnI family protein [Streptomyces samsunensis]
MRLRRLPVIGCLTAGGLVLLTAGPAFAHVSVQPGQAEKGGYSTINFKVPNERDDSSTVKLEVNLPADHPLASVMPQPVPGWDVKVTKSKLAKPMEMHGEKINEAVTKVTWTGGKIEPGMFQQFPLSVGQLPEDADQLVFKALQTYDNKEVVRWIEEPQEGAAEPENPAPVLKLVAPAKGSDGQDAAAASGQGQGKDSEKAGAENSASEDASDDKDGSDTTARVLGIAGIVVGAAGVAFGVVASRRRSA